MIRNSNKLIKTANINKTFICKSSPATRLQKYTLAGRHAGVSCCVSSPSFKPLGTIVLRCFSGFRRPLIGPSHDTERRMLHRVTALVTRPLPLPVEDELPVEIGDSVATVDSPLWEAGRDVGSNGTNNLKRNQQS